MKRSTPARSLDGAKGRDALFSLHNGEWRDSMQVISHWKEASEVDPRLLRYRVRGAFWETLERLGVTLLVTREYEHLLMALCTVRCAPHLTYLRLPHPSGSSSIGSERVSMSPRRETRIRFSISSR